MLVRKCKGYRYHYGPQGPSFAQDRGRAKASEITTLCVSDPFDCRYSSRKLVCGGSVTSKRGWFTVHRVHLLAWSSWLSL